MGHRRMGDPNFQYLNETDNITEYDTAGTTYTSGGGKLIAATTVVSGAPAELDLDKLRAFLVPGDTLSILAKVTSGAASNVTVAVNFQEDL